MSHLTQIIWVSFIKDNLKIFLTTHRLLPRRPPIVDPWDLSVDVYWNSGSKPSYFPLTLFLKFRGHPFQYTMYQIESLERMLTFQIQMYWLYFKLK